MGPSGAGYPHLDPLSEGEGVKKCEHLPPLREGEKNGARNSMVLLIIACAASGFFISAVVTAVVRAMAPKWGLVDQPAARKVHETPTALGGGIGIWLGTVLPLAGAQLFLSSTTATQLLPEELAAHVAGIGARSGQLWAIIAWGTLLAVMGLIDDLKNLPWAPRLAVQLIAAIGLVSMGVRATLFADAAWIGAIVTVLWILVLTNSFNFLDNMDGLTSGIGLITSVIFALIMLTSTSEPRWFVAAFLLILAGSLGGFLCHNFPPARIFMGDAGSYFVGLSIASMTVVGTFYEYEKTPPYVMLAPLCVLAIPLYDFCSVMIIRLSEGRSPFHADKCHFSHRLVELGLSRRDAVLTIHLATLTTGLGGLLLYQVSNWAGALIVVALILCVLAVIAILETAARRHQKKQ